MDSAYSPEEARREPFDSPLILSSSKVAPRAKTAGYFAVVATWLVLLIAAGHLQATPSQQTAGAPAASSTAPQATLQRYCLTCHNQNLKDRGTVPIALDKMSLGSLAADADVWERVVRKVRTGTCPKAGTGVQSGLCVVRGS